jgi:siroheme synthase
LVGTLATIAREVAQQGIPAPASIIVGEVVALQAKLGELQRSASDFSSPLAAVINA